MCGYKTPFWHEQIRTSLFFLFSNVILFVYRLHIFFTDSSGECIVSASCLNVCIKHSAFYLRADFSYLLFSIKLGTGDFWFSTGSRKLIIMSLSIMNRIISGDSCYSQKVYPSYKEILKMCMSIYYILSIVFFTIWQNTTIDNKQWQYFSSATTTRCSRICALIVKLSDSIFKGKDFHWTIEFISVYKIKKKLKYLLKISCA